MSDSNQIIKVLHERADNELRAKVNALKEAAKDIFHKNNTWVGTGVVIGKEEHNSWTLVETAMDAIYAACQEKARQQAVDAFMARVATLSKDIDEIRAIAEQGQSQ